jgi:hypothetical protein
MLLSLPPPFTQDKDLVDRLLVLKTQLDEVLRDAFASSPAFPNQLTSCLQHPVSLLC